jgi:hypothetical protein
MTDSDFSKAVSEARDNGELELSEYSNRDKKEKIFFDKG